MTTTTRQKRMAKKRNARIQALVKRICNRVDNAVFVFVTAKPMQDIPHTVRKYRTPSEPERGYTATARQKH